MLRESNIDLRLHDFDLVTALPLICFISFAYLKEHHSVIVNDHEKEKMTQLQNGD